MTLADFSQHRPSLYTKDARTKARNAAEKRFRVYGIVAVGIGVLALIVLLSSVLGSGLGAFRQTMLSLPVTLDAKLLDPKGNRDPADLAKATTITYGKLLSQALEAAVTEKGLAPEGMKTKDIGALISKEAPAILRNQVLANPDLIGTTIDFEALAGGRIDGFFKGRVTMESAALDSNVSPAQLELAQAMRDAGMIKLALNPSFITNPDASELRPESAGLGVAILGSAYMMVIVLVLSLPIGVAASIYLEEFAPQNRFTDLIEVNIANLAAVPSIVFGILGLAVFINFAGMPQSSPLVGGLVLTLMTLPTIIIATRAALKAVPPSIKDAALGVGASKMQTIFHHVLPL
ncbi:PstA family ABC transporter permease, partial [Rhodobacter lacus]